MTTKILLSCLSLAMLVACSSSSTPEVLGMTEPGNGPVVNFDVHHLPFAEIPLPNDFATRYDASSPTKRRLNASILAGSTQWEQQTRAELDKLSGWGTLAPITVSFSKPIDPQVIVKHHYNDNFDYKDDAVLVLDVSPGSPGFCEAVPLDLGQGNYPQVLAQTDVYESDPRADLQTMTVEETEEDANGNGELDPGEDTDMDGVLDHPDTLDGTPTGQRLEFYERETNTLYMKPVMPMREATTYAVVLTKRLVSPSGDPVRSPFEGINHGAQTAALSAAVAVFAALRSRHQGRGVHVELHDPEHHTRLQGSPRRALRHRTARQDVHGVSRDALAPRPGARRGSRRHEHPHRAGEPVHAAGAAVAPAPEDTGVAARRCTRRRWRTSTSLSLVPSSRRSISRATTRTAIACRSTVRSGTCRSRRAAKKCRSGCSYRRTARAPRRSRSSSTATAAASSTPCPSPACLPATASPPWASTRPATASASTRPRSRS